MAKVRDKNGHEIEGQSIVTEAQAAARERWAAKLRRKNETALERQKARTARSSQEQLALLDKRLGAGVGAEKERARLSALID